MPRPAETPDRRGRVVILLICSMSLLIVGLDTTIVNVALPAIHRELHASVSGLQWTIDAYTLVLASLLLLSGSTADRLGRRRLFQIGLVSFSAGSLLCALAPNLELLIVFRIVQAVGGSMLNPVAMSIIRNVFTDPRERAQAIGVWGGVVGVSLALGPVVGGALVDSAGWRAVFLVNVPIGALALVLTALFVPESRAARARRIDPPGQLLVIAGLASLTGAIIEGPRHGWGSPFILGLFALAAVSFAALVAVERRRRDPLIDLRFFSSAPFAGASLAAICAFAMLGGMLFLTTLYLQGVRGYSPLGAGLRLLPMAAITVVCAPLSGRAVARYGTRPSLVLAGIALTVAALLLTGLDAGTSDGYILGTLCVYGFGFALVNPPITNTAVSGMPAAQAGVAAGVASTSRQVGATLGVALAGAIAGSGVGGTSAGHAFAADTRAAWLLLAGFGATITVLGVLTTTRWAQGTAERIGTLLEDEPVAALPVEPAPVAV